jgi:hypothetical protein
VKREKEKEKEKKREIILKSCCRSSGDLLHLAWCLGYLLPGASRPGIQVIVNKALIATRPPSVNPLPSNQGYGIERWLPIIDLHCREAGYGADRTPDLNIGQPAETKPISSPSF